MGNNLTSQYQEVGRGFTPEKATLALETVLLYSGYQVVTDYPVSSYFESDPSQSPPVTLSVGFGDGKVIWNSQGYSGTFAGNQGKFSAQLDRSRSRQEPILGYGFSPRGAIEDCLCANRETGLEAAQELVYQHLGIVFKMTSTTRLGTGPYRVMIQKITISTDLPPHYRARLVLV